MNLPLSEIFTDKASDLLSSSFKRFLLFFKVKEYFLPKLQFK